MFTVYVINSVEGLRYTGYTSDLRKRLEQHNAGVTFATKKGSYWRLIYSKAFNNKTDAIIHEKYLKTGVGREYLEKHICPVV